MVALYPVLCALGVFVGALLASALALQATQARRAMAREHLAARLGRGTKGRSGGRKLELGVEGPVGRRLRHVLLRAGEPMTVNELLTWMVAASAVGVVALGVVSGPLLAVVGLGVGVLPVLHVQRVGRQRSAAIALQLPEAFDLMSRALRAGHAFADALHLCSKELPAPLGQELALVAERNRLGLDLRTCMLELADRQEGNFDVHLFVSMVLLHQETGGNLIDTLHHLAQTIRERSMAVDKLAALTAEVRMSALIVGSLPFFVAGMLLWIRPGYLAPLVHSPLGQKFALVAIGSLTVGFFAMRKLARVEA